MLVRIALFAALGGFLFGYDLGLIGPALEGYKEAGFSLSTVQYGFIVGAAKMGAVLGTFLGGGLMLYYGRQPTVAFNSVFFVTGPAIMAAFWPWWCLVIGRLLVGLGIGVSAVVVPAYLGEVAPAKLRGGIVELYELMLCLGMACAQLFDLAVSGVPGDWRWMMGAPIVPGALLLFALIVLPESPRWLVVQGRLDEALAVMHRIYTNERLPGGAQTSTAEVEHELMLLWSGVEHERAEAAQRRAAAAAAAAADGRSITVRRRGRAIDLDGAADTGSGDQRTERDIGLWGKMTARHRARRFQQLREDEQQQHGSSGDGGMAGAVAAYGEGEASSMHRGGGHDNGGGSFLEMAPLDGGSSPLPDPFAVEGHGQLHDVDLKDEVAGLAAFAPDASDPTNDRSPLPGEKAPAADLPTAGAQPSTGASGNGDGCIPSSGSTSNGAGQHRQHQRRASDAALLGSGRQHSASMSSACSRTGISGFFATWAIMLWDIVLVGKGQEARAFWVAMALAFFNQAMGSTAVIEYMPHLLRDMGMTSERTKSLLTATVSLSKLVGVTLALLLVDLWGRRPLLLVGSFLCTCFLALLSVAQFMGSVPLLVASTDLFIAAFSLSWAGIFWVLLSELFSMAAKSPACSMATGLLFFSGAVTDLMFPLLVDWMGGGASFLVFTGVAAASGIFVFFMVPETKGRTLQEVQQLMGGGPPSSTSSSAAAAAAARAGQQPNGSSSSSLATRDASSSSATAAAAAPGGGAAAAAAGEEGNVEVAEEGEGDGNSRARSTASYGWVSKLMPARFMARRWQLFTGVSEATTTPLATSDAGADTEHVA